MKNNLKKLYEKFPEVKGEESNTKCIDREANNLLDNINDYYDEFQLAIIMRALIIFQEREIKYKLQKNINDLIDKEINDYGDDILDRFHNAVGSSSNKDYTNKEKEE